MALKTAAMTMLRSDDIFLRKWVEYYSSLLGRGNLFIVFDGEDQEVPDFCEGCNIKKTVHVEADRLKGDRLRAEFLSREAARLFESYDIVIGTDVDEFLIPDPALGLSLTQMLERNVEGHKCLSALGIDVGQNLREEGAIDPEKPFLSQRSYAKLSTRYTKSCVLAAPLKWGSGFHRVKGHNFHIIEGLYLFHFGCVDLGRLEGRMGDRSLAGEGWSGHLRKRAATIRLASRAKAREWDKATSIARKIQTHVRSPFAWNKPAMFEARVLVRIPERFKGIV